MQIVQRIIILITWLFSSFCFSQTLVNVVDQNGQPLADAVLEITGINGLTKPDSPQTYIMDQVNKSFAPHVLLVPENSLVSFPNSDDIRHHVYSFSKVKTFELKLYAGKPKAPIMFEQAGIVVLGCNIHDAMVGYIYIHPNQLVYKTNDKGQVLIDTDFADATAMWLWHPRAKLGVDQRMSIDKTQLTQKQATQLNSEITLVMPVLPPETRDSFEDVFTHAQ